MDGTTPRPVYSSVTQYTDGCHTGVLHYLTRSSTGAENPRDAPLLALSVSNTRLRTVINKFIRHKGRHMNQEARKTNNIQREKQELYAHAKHRVVKVTITLTNNISAEFITSVYSTFHIQLAVLLSLIHI